MEVRNGGLAYGGHAEHRGRGQPKCFGTTTWNDWGLYGKRLNVWQPSRTRQEAYGNAKQYWERVMRKGKS